MCKYIFITGGVVSSLGKGITSSSLGRLLIERGLKVNIQKLDPYINVDSKIMNPSQHGEIFVTSDGCETDLDLGHYERFLDIDCTSRNNYTSGKIYNNIIGRERSGEYSGSAIQVVPHVTSEIKVAIKSLADNNTDVVIVEVGGTVGDIENEIYLEAIRQLENELGRDNYVHIHCTFVPYLQAVGEVKTKPTQHSIRMLNSKGIIPDIIVCRTNKGTELSNLNRKKIAMFGNLIDSSFVIHNPDCDTIYEVPVVLFNQGLDRLVISKLNLDANQIDISKWKSMVDTITSDLPSVNIAIVGKYTEISDAYLSIKEAIYHASYKNRYRAKIDLISSEDIEICGAKEMLKSYNGIIVPGGFGARGTEGKIMTATYCRENKVPYLGISFGMQTAIIEFARNVANLKDANSTEIDNKTDNPVIIENNINSKKYSQMRLGDDSVHLKDGTMARRLYGLTDVKERHRNSYEFNNEYKDNFEKLGMIISGENVEKGLVEIIEYTDHPFFVGTSFQPEFKSRIYRPHPLFVGFISGAITNVRKPSL